MNDIPEEIGDWLDSEADRYIDCGPYSCINDAVRMASLDQRLSLMEEGDTEIWYATHPTFKAEGVDPDNLPATHTLLGKIACVDLERIFMVMQGEMWSPAGQANQLIRNMGLHHTSMSVGDVVKLPNGSIFVCDMAGWKKLA